MTTEKSSRPGIFQRNRHASRRKMILPGFPTWYRLKRRLQPGVEPRRTEQSMLPMLIQVFAGFTKLDGRVESGEVDSILGFLRYDYPETVYSELRQLFIGALGESQDLEAIATKLNRDLPIEEKVLLGVQLYVLISRAGIEKENLITFYQFMTSMGVASEAVNIVYQLNTSELGNFSGIVASDSGDGTPTDDHRLETVIFSSTTKGDVSIVVSGNQEVNVAVFRFQNLVLIKNLGPGPIIARGRQVNADEFCRLYEGQRILMGEDVFSYEDVVFFFNAKKNVSSVQLFLAQDGNGNQVIEKTRTKQSYLRVSFGLKINVEVLNSANANISNRPLIRGDQFEVSAREHIDFENHSSLTFAELRQRARELGGRFSLTPNRTEYLVSNNPDHLSAGDILLTSGASGDIILRIRCHPGLKSGQIEVIESERPVSVEGEPVKGEAPINDGDVVYLGDGQYLRCHFSEGIIEEERNVINSLKVREVGHSYDRRTRALEGISFSVQRGEMVCILGPSGCGKSTLLRTLAGQQKPTDGKVAFNNVNLYEELENLSSYIAFIPQDETFDPLLTVEENLDTAAAIRAPHFLRSERRRRADSRMVELGLHEIRHRLAGDAQTKSLSGGQRRRLNAGMDMIGIADVFLFDEPTSGLSSKDSEHVLETIRGLTHNKITLVSIHQPSSRLFHMFDKAILVDKGGRLVFFGTPSQMLEYFNEARIREGVGTTAYPTVSFEEASKLPPDFIFDILETPLRDLGGDVIYENDDRGNLVPARRFSPDFWNERFQTYRLLEEVNLREVEADTSQTVSFQKTPQRPQANLKQDWVRFVNQFKRAFLSKLRNHTNLAATLLVSPALALLMGIVLRYTDEPVYNFNNGQHIATYLFLCLVVALFLGLSNSAEEIIREKNLLIRERHYGFRVSGYIVAKYISLGFFALIQNIIFLLIADPILGIRGMFFHNLFWMFATSMVGIAAGLFVSSVVNNPKTASNLIPMIMIPNIILGGALIKYEEMNRDLRFVDQIQSWFGGDRAEETSALKVPGVCHLMPLRWSYESMIITHHTNSLQGKVLKYIEDEVERYSKIPLDQEFTEEQDRKFRQLKNAKPIVIAMQSKSASEVKHNLKEIYRSLKKGDFDASRYQTRLPEGKVRYTPEMLYRNQDIYNLFTAAEVERLDVRREANPPNVFFGDKKYFRFPYRSKDPWFSFSWDTLYLNTVAMLGFISGAFVCLYISLKKQLSKV
ncbi:MAG: ATP-binding cassette domain-containing protein [Verrucomicrobiales bacterium]|nr:ATP-binding cassette domain-containing protein [Verrucomicrobiales bacterium]